jgi:hypothetical protein
MMRSSQFTAYAGSAFLVVGAALFAGCAGGLPAETGQSVGGAARPVAPASVPVRMRLPAWYREAPAGTKKGIYVGEFFTSNILGYAWDASKNLPPICELPASFVVDVATDPSGDLIDPDGGSREVIVYHGPAMCGSQIGSFSDTAGQPSDAATHNAATGTIYVGNIQATGQAYGNVSVCTLAAGCSAVLSNSAIGGQLFSVAEDKHGNVYASGYVNPTGGHGNGSGAALVVWRNGTGSGTVIKSYRNKWPGGLEVDRAGNLLAFDTFAKNAGALFVYTGCPSQCKAHGPFPLKGESVYGKVNPKSNLLMVGDFEYGKVDVYRYRGTKGITYLYSFSNGISPSGDVEGIAIDAGIGGRLLSPPKRK